MSRATVIWPVPVHVPWASAQMVAGGTLVFGGELSEFARRSCVAVMAIAFLVLGAGFMTALFGVGGATVL